jgi:hypothetical protein
MSANSLFEAAARFVVFTGSIPVGLPVAILPREPPIGILTCPFLGSAGHPLCNHLFLHRLLRPHVQGRQESITALYATHPQRKFITRLPRDSCLGTAGHPFGKLSSPEGTTTVPQDTARVCACVCMHLRASGFAANEAGKRLKAAEDEGPKHPQAVYDHLVLEKAELHAHARALETHAATVCALSAHSFVSAATAIKGRNASFDAAGILVNWSISTFRFSHPNSSASQ